MKPIYRSLLFPSSSMVVIGMGRPAKAQRFYRRVAGSREPHASGAATPGTPRLKQEFRTHFIAKSHRHIRTPGLTERDPYCIPWRGHSNRHLQQWQYRCFGHANPGRGALACRLRLQSCTPTTTGLYLQHACRFKRYAPIPSRLRRMGAENCYS
jgi:hypothetical protein